MNKNTTALLVNNPDNVSKLTSPSLRKYVVKALDAKLGVNKNMWKYVINMNNIIVDELFKDEPLLKTQKALAQAMDDKESNLSKYTGAIDCITNKMPAYGYDMTNMTYSNAYLLSTIDNLDDFMKIHADTDFSKIGKNQLEKLISAFKHPEKQAVEVEPKQETTEETEAPQEEKQEMKKGDIVAHIEKGVLTFCYRNKNYSVPMKDLKSYIVEDEEEQEQE